MNHATKEALSNVSRETSERLEIFAKLLTSWNKKINLVAPATIGDLWERHILDSVGVFNACEPIPNHVADLGSGAGLPGLLMAVMDQENGGSNQFTLIESDARKGVFCRTAAREMGVKVTVITQRIEAAPPQNAGLVTARALAPLPKLLDYVARHLGENGVAVLPKGAQYKKEVEDARQTWNFTVETRPSLSDSNSAILRIGDLTRA